MKKGRLVAQIDAGPAGGPAVVIGELLFEGKKLGELKIPAGLTAEVRLSTSGAGHIVVEKETVIKDGELDPPELPE